jgi:outer membrane protein OmpA-like peptidoglycan-associated protein
MKTTITSMLIFVFLCLTSISFGQINIPARVKNKTINRVERKVDQGIDKGLDAIEDDITGKNKNKKAPVDNQNNAEGNERQNGENSGNNDNKPAMQEQPAMKTYSKFDFVPGEKVIFYEDFSQDAVGDFPALWNTNGSAEVVTTNLFPGNWLQFNGRGAVWTDQLLNLPDNYTIEFDIIPTAGEDGRMAGYDFRLIKSINEKSYDHGSVPGKAGFLYSVEYFGRSNYRTYMNEEAGRELGLSGHKDDESLYQKTNQKYHISIWIQKARVRLYMNENKLFDLPKAFQLPSIKMDRIRFEEGTGLVSNIRIAVGAPDTRNKLMNEGKLVTYGIYFDVNKDVVKPESYGTLKEIATILNEVPDVKVKILGHTDADGTDDMNLDLSKRRAASVKAELAKSFGVKADRLETDGMGESQPVAPNDTPVNKALNRRVEFIKL